MRRRGHVVYLLAMVLAASVALGVSFVARHTMMLNARRGDAQRTQALWLARSGCRVGQLPRTVKTSLGQAELSRIGSLVRVALAGSVATTDCSTHEERFTPAPR